MTAEPPDAPSSNALTLVPPPPDLAPGLFGFVRRIDPGCGGVVRILPEIRSSIQVHAADPYWVREQAPDAEWRQAPRVSLWGPRHDWGWGYARRDVSAYAVGLTAAAARVDAPHEAEQARRQIRRRRGQDQSATLWGGGHGRILQSRRRKSG